MTLSRPRFPSDAQDRAQHRARIVLRRRGPAGARHPVRGAEQPGDVESHDGRRSHAEVGERGIAAPDRREPEQDVPESVRPRRLLELRARIGDRDEVAARLAGADRVRDPLEEVLLEDVRLERRAGLRRHDEHGPAKVNLRLGGPDLGGIGRVQDGELRPSGERPEGHAEDLGTEARAAHAEQQGVREAGLSHVLGDAPELVDPPELLVHDLEPSEPARLGPAGPEVRVARPEPLDLALLGPLAECGGNGGIEIGRHGPGPRVQHIDSPAMLGPRVRSG